MVRGAELSARRSGDLCFMFCLLAALATTTSVPSAELLSLIKAQGLPASGYVCGPAAGRRIAAACEALEAEAARPAFPRDLMALDGEWRLLYSSTLAASMLPDVLDSLIATLRGPLATSPLAPQNVIQRIDVRARRVVNALSLSPWPGGAAGNFLSALPGPLGDVLGPLQQAQVFLELDHSFAVEGEGGAGKGSRRTAAGSVVSLNLERVRRRLEGMPASGGGTKPDGGVGVGALVDLIPRESDYELPGPLQGVVAGGFDTTYVDEMVRISRGIATLPGAPGGEELRVFERIGGRGTRIFRSWQEEEEELARAAAKGQPLGEWEDRWQEGGMAEVEGAEGFVEGGDSVPD